MPLSTRYYYCNTIEPTFELKISQLLSQIPLNNSVLSISFFGNSTEENYATEVTNLKLLVRDYFGESPPLVTYVIQSSLCHQDVCAEVHFLPSIISIQSVNFNSVGNIRYATFNYEQSKCLIIEGIYGEGIFTAINTILQRENMQISDIVRQWNYIGGITESNNGIQNYQNFNNQRAAFYANADWENGYPAATGIGMDCNGLLTSVVAVSKSKSVRILSIDNPLQVPAHHYSKNVLIGKEISNATPKFERAKLIQYADENLCFVSGTAAIRGEQSMANMDASAQTKQTIENILFLISAENMNTQNANLKEDLVIKSLRVYIKHHQDLPNIKDEIEKVWAHVPVLYLDATICRSELLLEIEGIANNKRVL